MANLGDRSPDEFGGYLSEFFHEQAIAATGFAEPSPTIIDSSEEDRRATIETLVHYTPPQCHAPYKEQDARTIQSIAI